MKKIIGFFFLVAVLSSCTSDAVSVPEEKEASEIVSQNFIVGGKENSYLNVYGNILNNNLNTLTSNINGEVTYIACEAGKPISKDTVVAKISPDVNSLSYKNNLVQINSLQGQLSNLKQIKATTIANFDSKYRQLELQESEIANQLDTASKTIGDDGQGLKNQLKIVEESLSLLEQNKTSSVKNIDDSILNLRNTAFNTIDSGIKRLDEVFGVTQKNKHLNDEYDDYFGTKNNTKKSQVRSDISTLIIEFESQDDKLSGYSNNELSGELDRIANIFKNAADVAENSTSSVGSLTQTTIDAWYKEFLGISNGLITTKGSYDTLLNSRSTTLLTFDTQAKELEQAKSQLLTQETTLNSNVKTLNNNSANLKEQFTDLENTKSSTIKEIESNILSLEQAINQLNITFREDVIYAGVNGTVKTKNVSKNNTVGIGTPVCIIVPERNSLKLEIYSPNKLGVGMEFSYYKDGNYIGTGAIQSESPVRNAMTQNYSYEADIDFSLFKEGDYLDIKAVDQVDEGEIWIPINYVFPKLDGYYVELENGDKSETVKVEVGKMNAGEILITSGLEFGDILKQ